MESQRDSIFEFAVGQDYQAFSLIFSIVNGSEKRIEYQKDFFLLMNIMP